MSNRCRLERGELLRTCLFLALLAPAGAGDEPDHLWVLTRDRWDGKAFPAVRGGLAAAPGAPARFADEVPHALLLGVPPRGAGAAPRAAASDAPTYLDVRADFAKLPREALSVEAWVRIDKTRQWGGIAGAFQDNGRYEKGWLLGYDETAFFFAVAGAKPGKLGYLKADRGLQTGEWYHVAGTYDGREQRLYVDGAPAARAAEQSGPIDYPDKGFFTLGAYRDDDELHPLQGRISRAALWSRALSPAEVKERFDASKAGHPGAEPAGSAVVDWPTWRRDNARSAVSDETPALPLRLAWTHDLRHAPRPAWPAPAKQDFWNRKPELSPRVTFDRAFPLAAVGPRIFVASSADDQLRCLDAATGELRWTFFAEGPIRLAPSVAGDRVLFGSDDGRIYCLRAETGELLWSRRPSPDDRRLPGNERIIASHPIRTGVLVEDGAVWYCAGLFPGEGVWHGSLDLATGRKAGDARVDFAPQGYMERRGDRLQIATGHDLEGAALIVGKGRGKGPSPLAARIPPGYPFAKIGAGRVCFAGGDGKVAAFEDGRELWSAPVEGRAWELAFAQGRLLVSTDRGRIHAFAPGDGSARRIGPPPAVLPEPLPEIPDAAGPGYALVFGDARLGLDLARRNRLTVVVVDEDPGPARALLDAAGAYGPVSVHALPPGGRLPYADGLFNLVVDARGAAQRPEIERVLRPHGGVALIGRERLTRGPVRGGGEWTHFYANPANSACSGDTLVGADLRLHWFGLPGPRELMDRHHRTSAPLAKDGRLFVPGYDRIFGVDAFNGAVLWERELPEFRRVAAFRDCGNMALAADRLYAAAGASCVSLDPATGERLAAFAAPEGDWGYVAVDGPLLYGTRTRAGASRRTQSRDVAGTETFWDAVPAVCSEAIFALDRLGGRPAWSRPARGPILNPTITIDAGRVFFVEGAGAAASGRAKLEDLLKPGARLVALDAATGAPAWEATPDLSATRHNLFAAAARDRLVLVGSRNEAGGVRYDVLAFDVRSGVQVWSRTLDPSLKAGGDHGEQDHHPLIAESRLIVEPYALDLMTGEVLDWSWRKRARRGCGTLSASASALFYRDRTAMSFDLRSGKEVPVTSASRPGCWINMIPAGGLLLMPEGSSGCSCNFGVQGSAAFAPVPARR